MSKHGSPFVRGFGTWHADVLYIRPSDQEKPKSYYGDHSQKGSNG
jgi:hypothetical protein